MRNLSKIGGLATTLVLATAIPAGAGGGGCNREATEGRTTEVEIMQNCFSPNIVRVEPGSTVTFFNRDSYSHNVVGHGWGIFEAVPAAGFSADFPDAGIYPFACTLHPGMVGAVVVEATPAPVAAAQTEADPSSGLVIPGLGVVGLTALAAWWRRRP